jgi:hypothetical protein
MISVGFAFALLVSETEISASPPVFEIFGISTEDKDHFPYSKSDCLKWDEDRIFCVTGWKIGNVRTASIDFTYTEGRLSEVKGQAIYSEFPLMLKNLELKYGKSKIIDGIHTWRFKGGALTAREIEISFTNNLMGCEFIFISTENSAVSERRPIVNF